VGVGAVLGPHDFPFSIGRSEAAHSFTAHLGRKMRRIFLTLCKCLGRAWGGGDEVSQQYAYLQIENCVPKTRYKDKSM